MKEKIRSILRKLFSPRNESVIGEESYQEEGLGWNEPYPKGSTGPIFAGVITTNEFPREIYEKIQFDDEKAVDEGFELLETEAGYLQLIAEECIANRPYGSTQRDADMINRGVRNAIDGIRKRFFLTPKAHKFAKKKLKKLKKYE